MREKKRKRRNYSIMLAKGSMTYFILVETRAQSSQSVDCCDRSLYLRIEIRLKSKYIWISRNLGQWMRVKVNSCVFPKRKHGGRKDLAKLTEQGFL